MKVTTILSLGFAAISTALAVPTDIIANLYVTSVNGELFKDRPLVALSEGTLPPDISVPATFGLTNFTVRSPPEPVKVKVQKIQTTEYVRYELSAVNKREWVAQESLPAPNDNIIAMGWVSALGTHDCPTEPEGIACDIMNWDVNQNALSPRAQKGAWDAVKTKEGSGWRIVWKKEGVVVNHEVRVTVVPV